MAKKLYEEKEVADVAETIRSITGKTTTYKLREMPTGVKEASAVMFNELVSGKATDIVIPLGCSKIRAYAFIQSKTIKTVEIESSRLDGVYYDAFAYCSALTEFRISNKCNIRAFGKRAFYNCANLKVIDLTNYSGSDIPTLDSIDAFDGVHADCVIIVPAKLYDQWISATNWSAVADMIVPDLKYGTVTYDFYHSGGTNLTDITGYGISNVGHYMVRDVVIPAINDGKTVVAVANDAFIGNTNIKSLTIYTDSIVIGREAFSNCTALESVVFKKTPKKIRREAFRGCSSCLIYDFSFCARIPALENDGFKGINENAKILVPKNLYGEWKSVTNWAIYADHIVAV